MRRQRRNQSKNSVLIVGPGLIIILALVWFTFFDKEFLFYKPLPYDELIMDEKYYSDSKIDGWHTIKLGQFKIETPNDYQFFITKGIDSYVGGITNGQDSIEFDYGMYSNSLESYYTDLDFAVKEELINGKEFRVILVEEHLSMAGCYTDDLKDDNKLMMICYQCDDLNQKLRMFRTIKFK